MFSLSKSQATARIEGASYEPSGAIPVLTFLLVIASAVIFTSCENLLNPSEQSDVANPDEEGDTSDPSEEGDTLLSIRRVLPSGVSASNVDASASSRVLAVQIGGGLHIFAVRDALSSEIDEDGNFTIELEAGDHSWLLMAVNPDATGFDKKVGFMAIAGDDVRLNTIPTSDAESDVDLGTLSFDSTATEFVAEFGLDAYSEALNLTATELRALAKTDSMAKRAANLYVNDNGSDYWNAMTVYNFEGNFTDAVEAYAPAEKLDYGWSYSRMTWQKAPYSIEDIASQAVTVEIYPPQEISKDGETWSPTKPFSNTGTVQRDDRDDGSVFLNFEGGLGANYQGHEEIGFQPKVSDMGGGRPLPGVWRIDFNGNPEAWMNFDAGSPYDAAGNLLVYMAEPRLRFNADGSFVSFDVQFMEPTATGFVDATASALRYITGGQMQLWGSDANEFSIYNGAESTDFYWSADHSTVDHKWHRDSPPPQGYVEIKSAALSSIVHGEHIFFTFPRDSADTVPQPTDGGTTDGETTDGETTNESPSAITLPEATISIDGDPADWEGIDPIITDGEDDTNRTVSGGDVVAVYVAADAENLYWRLETADGSYNTSGELGYRLQFFAGSPGQFNLEDLEIGLDYWVGDSGFWNPYAYRLDSTEPWNWAGVTAVQDDWGAVGATMEMKIPRSLLSGDGVTAGVSFNVLPKDGEVSPDLIEGIEILFP